MTRRIQSKHLPVGNVFDAGRLPPAESALSLAVWKGFINRKLPLLRSLEMMQFSSNSDRQIVCLVERRSPYMEFVILNSMAMLGNQWGFQILTSTELVPWLEELAKDYQGVRILPVRGMEDGLNELKRKKEFWEKITGEHLLMINADTILCNGNVNEYLQYDYVAALWRKEDVSPWCCFGGGVSLRRKSVMLRVCSECNINPKLIPDESVFISMMLRLQPEIYNLPDDSLALKFSVERCFSEKPFSLHKSWQFIKHRPLSNILEKIDISGKEQE